MPSAKWHETIHQPRRGVRVFRVSGALGCLLLLSTAAPATARDCLEEVDRLAREYDISSDPPQPTLEEGRQLSVTPAPGKTASEELAESGGVIEPPEQGKARIVEPPDVRDPMATAPDIEQQPGQTPSTPELDAADRAQIQGLLTAARAAAEQGDAEDCFERLQEAQNIAGQSGQ